MTATHRILALLLPRTRWRVVTYATREGWYHAEVKRWWFPWWLNCGRYLDAGEAERAMQALSGFTPLERVIETDTDANSSAALEDRW